MTDRDESPTVRLPEPEAAARDPRNVAAQDQVKRDHAALEAQKRRVDASIPGDIRDRPVKDIVRDYEQQQRKTDR